MPKLRAWILRFCGLFSKQRKDRELDDEIESHVQMHIEDNLRLGMTPEEARRQAMLKLGGIESTKEACRDQRGLPVLETLWQDIRFGARMLRKSPGFTAVAVLTLALGIGANTAIFSVINTLMFRPLPYADAKRIFWVEEISKDNTQAPWGGHFLDWQEQSQTLEAVGAYDGSTETLTGSGEAERVEVAKASAGFLHLLGVQPMAPGRNFSSAEDRPGDNRVAILSHDLWQRRYNSAPDIIGRSITLNDASFTVIGVLPATFRFLKQFDIWVPLALDPQRELVGPFFSYQSTLACLKVGVTLEQAQVELDTLLHRYETTRLNGKPRFADLRTHLVPLRDHLLGNARRLLVVLSGAVALVLLIACANVANLLLARAVTRQKELAIRAALGAGRLRLTRQMLTECLLLAMSGGAVGFLLACWLTSLLGSFDITDSLGQLPRVTAIAIDLRVFGFALAVSVLTGTIFGLFPILRLVRPDLNVTLREGGRSSKSHGRGVRGALLVSEVAFALVLLAGAGLLIRSFAKLIEVNPGYRADNLLTAQLRLPPRYDGEPKRAQFYDRVLQRVAALPGVVSIGATSQLPLTSYNMGGTLRVQAPGRDGGKREVPAPITSVNANYFHTMGIGLRAGRLFDEGDTQGTPSVAVLSATLAQKLFPNEDPVGKRLFVPGSGAEGTTVIGVASDIRHDGLDREIELAAYLSYRQLPRPMMSLVLRSRTEPMNLVPALRQAVREIDPALPLYDVMTMDERLHNSIAGRRFNLRLLGTFAALALLLAGVGVYGVIAYGVTERTHEVGIRMALGAGRGEVVALVVSKGMKMTGVGVVLGVLVGLGLTRVMTRLLFGVTPSDPITFIGTSMILLLVALFASWLPARRAARVDPIVALRTE